MPLKHETLMYAILFHGNVSLPFFLNSNRLITFHRGDLNNALTRALEDPPYGRHLEAAKVIAMTYSFYSKNSTILACF